MHLRRILSFGLALMILALAAVAMFSFLKSLRPTDATIQRHFITIDLAEIPPGTARLIETTRGPIYVVHRTKEDLSNLDKLAELVRDPSSTISRQPAYAQNAYRAITPEWFITFGFSSRRGLPVKYVEQLPPHYDQGVTFFGGFFDQYDGALFDKAGRVLHRGHPDESNLPVPEYRYVDAKTIEIYPFGL